MEKMRTWGREKSQQKKFRKLDTNKVPNATHSAIHPANIDQQPLMSGALG